jgi:hypothetical protein
VPQPACDNPKTSLAEQFGVDEDAGPVLGFDDGAFGCVDGLLLHARPPQHDDEALCAVEAHCIGNVTGPAGDEPAVGVGVASAGLHVMATLGSAELPQEPGLPSTVLGWLPAGWVAGWLEPSPGFDWPLVVWDPGFVCPEPCGGFA